jgi:hypothetical protein
MFTLAAVLAATALAHPGFTAHVDNPYFPLLSGMRWEYRGVEEGHPSRDVVRVTGHIRHIQGVPCMAISDRVWIDGRLAERTTDWYTQGPHGTVWYYGERTAELDRHGRVTSREGSWRAGVDGARPGIYMPAHPRIGEEHAQEHYAGHAEDRFRVVRRHATVHVPYGDFPHSALETREWTPLEPGIRDGKWYAKGIGQVSEATLKGPQEHAELVSFHR